MPQILTISYVRPLLQNTYSYRQLFGSEEKKQPSHFKCALASVTALVECIAYGILSLVAKICHPHEQDYVHHWRFAKGAGAAFLVGAQGIIHPEKAIQIHEKVIMDLDNEFDELIKQQHRHIQKINKTIRQQHVDVKSYNQHFFNCSELNQQLLEKISKIVKNLESTYPTVKNLEKYSTLETAYADIHAVLLESKAGGLSTATSAV